MARPPSERQAADGGDGLLFRENNEREISDRVAQRRTRFTQGSQPLLLHRTDELNDVMVRARFERISTPVLSHVPAEVPGSGLRSDRPAAKLQFVMVSDVFDGEASCERGCFLFVRLRQHKRIVLLDNLR